MYLQKIATKLSKFIDKQTSAHVALLSCVPCMMPSTVKIVADAVVNTRRTSESSTQPALTEHLGQYLTDNRKSSIERVLASRTRYVTVVLEDIYQSHNASAVVRTCECMGLQDLHIIENKSKYGINKKVLKGSNKWISIRRYKEKGKNNTETCLNGLRAEGYRILAMDPDVDGVLLDEVPLTQKVALVMGNELRGLTGRALQLADMKVRVPMVGFTESLNISVCAAVSMNILLTRLKQLELPTGLSDREKDEIRLEWYRKCVRGSDIIEREFMKNLS